MLGRAHGIWWSAIEHRIDRDLRVPACAHRFSVLRDELNRIELHVSSAHAPDKSSTVTGRPVRAAPADVGQVSNPAEQKAGPPPSRYNTNRTP